MKTVTGRVISAEPISLSKAAKLISGFASSDNGASQAVSAYLRRTCTAFTELKSIHREIKSKDTKPRSERNPNGEFDEGKTRFRKSETVSEKEAIYFEIKEDEKKKKKKSKKNKEEDVIDEKVNEKLEEDQRNEERKKEKKRIKKNKEEDVIDEKVNENLEEEQRNEERKERKKEKKKKKKRKNDEEIGSEERKSKKKKKSKEIDG